MPISQSSHHIQSLTSLCHRVDLEQASENFFLHVFSERGWFFSTKLIIYLSQSFPTHSEVESLSGSHQSHPWPPLPICDRESWTVTTKIQQKYKSDRFLLFFFFFTIDFTTIANSRSSHSGITSIPHSSLGDLGVAVHDDEDDEEEDDEEEKDDDDSSHRCWRFFRVRFSYFETRLGEITWWWGWSG